MRGKKAKQMRKAAEFHPASKRTYRQMVGEKYLVPERAAHPEILRATNQVKLSDQAIEAMKLDPAPEGKVWVASKRNIVAIGARRVYQTMKRKAGYYQYHLLLKGIQDAAYA
jgi:hypothetical protein